MLDKLRSIEEKYEGLTSLLMDPKVHANQAEFQKYSREHSELQALVTKIREYKTLMEDLNAAEEILNGSDPELKELAQAELDELKKMKPVMEDALKFVLLPVDPRDSKTVILHIRAG